MSRKKGRVELSEYAGMARRVLRAYGERFASEGDEPELIQLLDLRDQLEQTIATATDHMLERESQSWTTIGRALGISRQAARQAGLRRKKRLAKAATLEATTP